VNRGLWIALVLALAGCAGSSSAGVPALAPVAQAAAQGSGPTFRAFTAGSTPGLPITAVPRDIVAGANGSMWFTDINTPAIGTISSSSKVTEFAAGLIAGSQPYSIVPGSDGNMWFSDQGGAIGRVTPSGKITEFRSRFFKVFAPVGITAGTDDAMWVMGSGYSRSAIFRVSFKGNISVFKLPETLIPDGALQSDTAGNLWFFASELNHKVVLVRRRVGGTLDVYATGLITKGEPCCPNLSAKHIAIGPNGHPWFTMPYFGSLKTDSPQVGTFASGAPNFFDVSRSGIDFPVYPSGIVRKGKFLWFSGSDPIGMNGVIWRMNLAGKQAVYQIPYNPAGFAAGSGSTLWFTAQLFNAPPQIVEATF
jgi:streptogramin lyase